MLQDAAVVRATGEAVSQTSYSSGKWLKATVPGTVLTSLVNDGIFPEPLYGLNNSKTNAWHNIPEKLARMTNWYRTQFTVPSGFAGRQIWLNFDGINYMAEVFVNGTSVGTIKGAFARGIFNVTKLVTPGKTAAVAVKILPTLHPGNPDDQTVPLGLGRNGGALTQDGPTFVCSVGWDWIPAIRDRDIGIWQKVTLSASGPVIIKDPLITSDLPLPRTDSADLTLRTTLQNVTDVSQSGVLRASFGNVSFQLPITLGPGSTLTITNTPLDTPELHVLNPRLWWPNGFGEPNLYSLRLSFEQSGSVSDTNNLNFGIRKITYDVPGTNVLTISVNGVPIFCKGGDWGMDEAMKRVPRDFLEAKIRLHKEANYVMIRNWVGQSTSEDFYDLCDRYGLMVWDEFFEANSSDGPNANDVDLYIANVREKVLRFRNHPSIAIWCGRNEGNPAPPALADGIKRVMDELEPVRTYHANSGDGRGVRSAGPYSWRPPYAFYNFPAIEVFKTEIGSASIPTMESILSMMPREDAENFPNDDWAEHDLARGEDNGDTYPYTILNRYTGGTNYLLPEFVRDAQMANYESYRALYEGRLAKMFKGSTAALTWMSNPAQPSATWQIYSYDLEPFASFFAVRKACEPVHIMMSQANANAPAGRGGRGAAVTRGGPYPNTMNSSMLVINNTTTALIGYKARVRVVNLDGTLQFEKTSDVTASPTAATDLSPIPFDRLTNLSAVHFVKLELMDASGKLVSDNFYWREKMLDDLSALQNLRTVTLDATITRHDTGGKCLLDVTLSNPTKVVALMAHVQLRKQGVKDASAARVLPVFYNDNYVSLLPGESRTITIEADAKLLNGKKPLVTVDGWNTTSKSKSFSAKGGASVAPNTEALFSSVVTAN